MHGRLRCVQARLVAQAGVCVVGGHVWLVGGWDPAAPGSGGDILSDVWRLDLATWAWTQPPLGGEALPAISRSGEVWAAMHWGLHGPASYRRPASPTEKGRYYRR